jgi:hypothetical protein
MPQHPYQKEVIIVQKWGTILLHQNNSNCLD